MSQTIPVGTPVPSHLVPSAALSWSDSATWSWARELLFLSPPNFYRSSTSLGSIEEGKDMIIQLICHMCWKPFVGSGAGVGSPEGNWECPELTPLSWNGGCSGHGKHIITNCWVALSGSDWHRDLFRWSHQRRPHWRRRFKGKNGKLRSHRDPMVLGEHWLV